MHVKVLGAVEELAKESRSSLWCFKSGDLDGDCGLLLSPSLVPSKEATDGDLARFDTPLGPAFTSIANTLNDITGVISVKSITCSTHTYVRMIGAPDQGGLASWNPFRGSGKRTNKQRSKSTAAQAVSIKPKCSNRYPKGSRRRKQDAVEVWVQ